MSQRRNKNGRGRIDMKRIGLEASLAIAEAVRLADADVIAAYPITPQTHIVERLADYVANGELNGQYIPVESEHSAMSACLGSSAVGARTFTATAGVGLELMHEVLYVASSMRLPIVMSVANRALSSPLSIWGDHSDAMSARDCGWIQIFSENAQQVFDLVLCAFRIAEDNDVLCPVMIHVDGFHVSHVIESLDILEESDIKGFIPPYKHPYPLDPAKPLTLGAFGMPNVYTEVKKAQDVDLRNTKGKIIETWNEFAKISGRKYSPVEKYLTDDADTLMVTMGSYGETAMSAIDELRNEGIKVGLLKIRLWRPFPFEEFKEAMGNAKNLIVLDRAISFGGPTGPVCSEIKAALYSDAKKPNIVSFVGGLGGRDITDKSFKNIIKSGIEQAGNASDNEVQIVEVR
jgi:pyruvate ferredoxin oxidoreductase alpha subunit